MTKPIYPKLIGTILSPEDVDREVATVGFDPFFEEHRRESLG
jgi:hypothetical protein